MKKEIVFCFVFLSLSFIFLNLNLVKAQETFPGVDTGQVENVTNQIGNAVQQFGQPNQYWNYMGNELQKIILGNPIAEAIDAFLVRISPVFFVLFAKDYSLSFSLLLTILLWIYFLLMFYSAFRNFASFRKGISFAVSFLLVVIMAQLKFFEVQINFLIWLFMGDKPWWMKLIIGTVIIGIFVMLIWLVKKFGRQFKQNREKMKELENRMKLEAAAKSGEPLVEALSKMAKEEK